MKFFRKAINAPLWPYLLISLLVTICYYPTFSGEFILDDHSLIENNPFIKHTPSLGSYLAQEDGITDRTDTGSYHTGYYRPLINVTYWMDYKLWGMKAPGFRATNFILHLLTCCLLFKFIVLLVKDRQAAFWATLLFALHPVNTESVSWIVSRNNILVTLFGLFSSYFYIKWCQGANHSHLILSIVLFVGAVFSKEFGLMILPIFFLYQRFLSQDRRNVSMELTSYIPFILLIISYFILRNTVTGTFLTPSGMGRLWGRIYFSPYLIGLNLKLILFPSGLHSFIIRYPDNYFSWQAIAGFFCMSLIDLFIWRERENKIVTFALLSFFLALFPVLNIIQTSAVTLISMRWLYFPMTFLSLAAAQFIKKSLRAKHFLTISILSLVVIYVGAYSYVLNKNLWHDEDTLFTQEVLSFNNYLYAGGLAENLLGKENYPEAERYFRIAIENYPHEAKNYINYSALLIETGRPEEAISLLNRARSFPRTWKERGEWYNNMGTAHFNLKKQTEALKYFMKAVRLWPNEPQFWGNLGAAYGSLGDYVNSVSALRRGLDMDRDSVQLRKNLAVAYRRMGDHAQAIKVLEKIRGISGQ